MNNKEEVICLNNFFTGRKSNLSLVVNNSLFKIIRHEITEPITQELDRTWYLVCHPSPIHYQYNPIKTSKNGFLGTHNMLGVARGVGARIFNTYGLYLLPNDGRVIRNSIVQAFRNEPLAIYVEGSETRAVCYEDDLIDGLMNLMNSNYSSPINPGNPEESSIIKLAKFVKLKIKNIIV